MIESIRSAVKQGQGVTSYPTGITRTNSGSLAAIDHPMKTIAAKFAGECSHCHKAILPGDLIAWRKTFSAHAECHRTFLNAGKAQKFALSDADKQDIALKVQAPTQAAPVVDMNALAAMIEAEVAKRAQPTTITVEVKSARGVASVENAHFYFTRLVKILGAGIPVYLWGPAGSGKTTAMLQAAKALGLKSEIDTLDPSTFRSMVQGYTTPNGEPVGTAFTRCWTEGKVYCGDEIDNAPGHVQTLFNSALAQGTAPLAWGNVDKADGFFFGGTGNTPGMPTREFPDRRPMSAAFKDRLYFMYWPLDPAIECRAAGLPVPNAPERDGKTCSATAWGRYVQRMRAYAVANMPTLMITPRATMLGVKALALGESPAEVADALIFRGADAEMRAKALGQVPLPTEGEG